MSEKISNGQRKRLKELKEQQDRERTGSSNVPLDAIVEQEAVNIPQRNSYTVFRPEIGEVLVIEENGEEYLLTERLGDGGGGVSFKAEDTEGNTKVVKIKAFNESEKANDRERRLQLKYSRLNKVMSHLGIEYEAHKVSALQVATIGNFVEGENLEQYIAERKFGEEETRALLLQIVEEYIVPIHNHKKGILHGDLKPANIIFGEKAIPIDFGDSKRTDTQTLTTEFRGTFGYAMDFGEVTRQHDYYALGQVAKFLMTGEHPLHKSEKDDRDRYNVRKLDELDISSNFRSVLLKMTGVGGSYNDANSLVSDLSSIDDVVDAELVDEKALMIKSLKKKIDKKLETIKVLDRNFYSHCIGGTAGSLIVAAFNGLPLHDDLIITGFFLGTTIPLYYGIKKILQHKTKKRLIELDYLLGIEYAKSTNQKDTPRAQIKREEAEASKRARIIMRTIPLETELSSKDQYNPIEDKTVLEQVDTNEQEIAKERRKWGEFRDVIKSSSSLYLYNWLLAYNSLSDEKEYSLEELYRMSVAPLVENLGVFGYSEDTIHDLSDAMTNVHDSWCDQLEYINRAQQREKIDPEILEVANALVIRKD